MGRESLDTLGERAIFLTEVLSVILIAFKHKTPLPYFQ